MAGIPKEHDKLYFDVLCRTQKLETVLSLIHATYQAKKSGVEDVKAEIAKRLENAYNLFKTNIRGTDSGSGTYAGTMKQFESQYTIGHELCIWSNSNLDLTPYALAVAEGQMTIREYFDIFFLSYFQPISGKGVPVLYLILKYMIEHNTKEIEKNSIPIAMEVEAEREDINALCNFLSDTSYINYDGKKLFYVGKESIASFIKRCNTTYLGTDGLIRAKSELNTEEKYITYIMSGKLKSDDMINEPQYLKFKKLLAWFVNQLNINNGIEEGNKTSGKGSNGESIQARYFEWRDYGEFTLDCTIQSGYLSTSSKANYIHKTHTGINIRPKFDKSTKVIRHLYIDLYNDVDHLSEDISKILEKEYLLDDLRLFENDNPNEALIELFDDYCRVIETLTKKAKNNVDYDNYNRLLGGENIILYGVPGAGKSWTIKHEYCDDDDRMERLVFHPDYTYSDFVGQILPRLDEDGSVSYEFTPGPFTKLLRKAYTNPEKMFFLVIEEVNRGNAPSIFGDIFQLLDRNKDGKSEYEITNGDIAKIVYENENHKISIPSNMSILCTMNTSDQNVFTLDTAFQRRWSMRLIKNRFLGDTEKQFAKTNILDTDVTWDKFFTEINKIILSKNIRMTSSEDKRLGTHFVAKEDLEYIEGNNKQNSKFPEKVLKYLWDDAFKFTKEDIFDLDKVKSLEEVIELFTINSRNERFRVFKDNIYNTLIQ